MQVFYETFGFVMAICGGIAALAIFFTVLGWIKRAFGGSSPVKVKGVFRDGKCINVHLAGGRTLAGVRFVGITESAYAKGAVPYHLSNMTVFETGQGSRIFVRSDSIKLIEEVPDAAPPPIASH